MYYATLESFIIFLKRILEDEYQTQLIISETADKSDDPNDYDPELECCYGNVNIKYIDIYNDEILDEITIPIDIFSDDLEDINSCSYPISHYIYSLNMLPSNYNVNIYKCLRKAVENYKKVDEGYELLNSSDYEQINKTYKILKNNLIRKMN